MQLLLPEGMLHRELMVDPFPWASCTKRVPVRSGGLILPLPAQSLSQLKSRPYLGLIQDGPRENPIGSRLSNYK
eukprot:1940904-Amphidinium_carterae.1